jgi:hypothetical protein
MAVDLKRERELAQSFYTFATGKIATVLLLKEREEQKNVYSFLLKQVIYQLFTVSFWDHLFGKVLARCLWLIIAGHTNVERMVGYTYNGLLGDWVKKEKINGQEDVEFIKSDAFDSAVIWKCRMIMSQDLEGKHKGTYETINAGIRKMDNETNA